MFGYFIGKALSNKENQEYKRVIITLNIPNDAKTNINRNDIIDSDKALYKCNKAKVVNIEDLEGQTYTEAVSLFYNFQILTYKVGEIVKEIKKNVKYKYFSISKEENIYFFLNEHTALNYKKQIENGCLTHYNDNGGIDEILNYKDGKLDGLYQKFNVFNKLDTQCFYKDGKLDGLYQTWYLGGKKQGDQMFKFNYKDGKLDGCSEEWSWNGKKSEKWFKNGKLITV
jgi:antitoxin component YwqK of YwqJK toxin-antitoxin module